MKIIVLLLLHLTFLALTVTAHANYFNCEIQGQADLKRAASSELLASAQVSQSFKLMPGDMQSASFDFQNVEPVAIGDSETIETLLNEIIAQGIQFSYHLEVGQRSPTRNMQRMSVTAMGQTFEVKDDNFLLETFASEHHFVDKLNQPLRIRFKAAIMCIEMIEGRDFVPKY